MNGRLAMILVASLSVARGFAFDKPRGPHLRDFVRVDVRADKEGAGFAAALPVRCTRANLVEEKDTRAFVDLGVLPEGYRFHRLAGSWQLFPPGGDLPLALFTLRLPAASAPVLTRLLEGANPKIYREEGLLVRLRLLGAVGLTAAGKDLSGILRLPFRRGAAGEIKEAYRRAFLWAYDDEDLGANDDERFTLRFCRLTMARRLAALGLPGPSLSGVAAILARPVPVKDEGRLHGEAVAETCRILLDTKSRSNRARNAFAVTLAFAPGKEAIFDLSRDAGPADDGPLPALAVAYHPLAEGTGVQTLPSFLEPRASGATLHLTALTLPDPDLSGLALRRESVHALRLRWLMKGSTAIHQRHAAALREALLRTTLPLWERLALSNQKAYLGRKAIPPLVTNRLAALADRAHSLLLNPSLVHSDLIDLDDCYEPSYFHPFADGPDHAYAAAAYGAWRLWSTKGEDLTNRAPVVASLARLIAAGYCRPKGAVNVGAAARHFAVTPEGEAILPATLVSRYGDLAWLAETLQPSEPSGSSGAGTNAMAPERVAACPLAPLLYPFSPLAKDGAAGRLLHMVRRVGISSIEGFPWRTSKTGCYALLADPTGVERIRAVLAKAVARARAQAVDAPGSQEKLFADEGSIHRMEQALRSSRNEEIARGRAYFLRLLDARTKGPLALLQAQSLGKGLAFVRVERDDLGARRLVTDARFQGFETGSDALAEIFRAFASYVESVDYAAEASARARRKEAFFDDIAVLLGEARRLPETMLLRHLRGDRGWSLASTVRRMQVAAVALGERAIFRRGKGAVYAPPAERGRP